MNLECINVWEWIDTCARFLQRRLCSHYLFIYLTFPKSLFRLYMLVMSILFGSYMGNIFIRCCNVLCLGNWCLVFYLATDIIQFKHFSQPINIYTFKYNQLKGKENEYGHIRLLVTAMLWNIIRYLGRFKSFTEFSMTWKIPYIYIYIYKNTNILMNVY